jgi:hypothetical protein
MFNPLAQPRTRPERILRPTRPTMPFPARWDRRRLERLVRAN